MDPVSKIATRSAAGCSPINRSSSESGRRSRPRISRSPAYFFCWSLRQLAYGRSQTS
jgi:hypothetical protein